MASQSLKRHIMLDSVCVHRGVDIFSKTPKRNHRREQDSPTKAPMGYQTTIQVSLLNHSDIRPAIQDKRRDSIRM